MLREHLSQAHDRASRRFETIIRQVEWLHGAILAGRPARVLDLGCGPGFYCSRLARKGHSRLGIDFSPASVDHARVEARSDGLRCEYRLQDLRAGGFGPDLPAGHAGFDLALLISGELNVLRREDATAILEAAFGSLAPGGVLVLEVHTEDYVRRIGEWPPQWSAQERGLFSDQPHLVLRECAWFPDSNASVERFIVVDAASARAEGHSITTAAYAEAGYESLLHGAGFGSVRRFASLEGDFGGADEDLSVYVTKR